MENKLNRIVDRYFGESHSNSNKTKIKISEPYDIRYLGRAQIINEKLIGIPEEWKKMLNIK